MPVPWDSVGESPNAINEVMWTVWRLSRSLLSISLEPRPQKVAVTEPVLPRPVTCGCSRSVSFLRISWLRCIPAPVGRVLIPRQNMCVRRRGGHPILERGGSE